MNFYSTNEISFLVLKYVVFLLRVAQLSRDGSQVDQVIIFQLRFLVRQLLRERWLHVTLIVP